MWQLHVQQQPSSLTYCAFVHLKNNFFPLESSSKKKEKKVPFLFPYLPDKEQQEERNTFFVVFFLLAIRFPAAHSALVKSSGLLSGALSQISLPVNPSQGPTNLRTPAETPSGAERRRHLPWLPLIADDWNKVVFGMITCQNCWQKGCRSWRCLEKLRPL